MPSAFRAQVESAAPAVLHSSVASSEQLKEFSTLVRSTPLLTDVGRATFIEWIALVHRARSQARTGLSYAHDAYRLRRRALGPSHPQCAASLRLIESLRQSKTKSALLEKKPSKDAKSDSIETSPEWLRAKQALESGAPEDLSNALSELRNRLDPTELNSASKHQLGDDSTFILLEAEILLQQGQETEAEELLVGLAEDEVSRSPVSKPATLLLADAYFDSGRLNECAALLEEFGTPADQREQIALLWRSIRLDSTLGVTTDVEQRFVEAFAEASKLRPRDLGLESLLHHELAEQLLERGSFQSALNHATSAATMLKAIGGEFHRSTLDARRVVARSMASLSQNQESSRQLSSLLELSLQVLGAQAPLTLSVQLDFARTLSESPQFDQNQALASELFARAQSGFISLYGNSDARSLDATQALAAHRLREGRPTSAAKLLRDVAQHRRALHGASALQTLDAARDLAKILDGLGATGEASTLLEANLKSCRNAYEADHWLLEQALNDLCEHYLLHNRPADEERTRLEQVALNSREL